MTYIADIKSLKNLSVRGTAITDRGVEAVSGLGLRSLFLSGTAITDQALKTLSSVKQLQRLSIRSCEKVTGSALKYLADLPTLQHLDVENCPLNAAGVAALGGFKHLIALEFGHVSATTSGIKMLSQIETLEYLNLNGTHVEAKWIPILGKLPRLRSLVVNAGTIDRQALALMPVHMPNLTQLQLRYTSLSDDMIAPLAELKDLQFLDMERSGVSKGAAERLRRLLSRPGHVVQIRY